MSQPEPSLASAAPWQAQVLDASETRSDDAGPRALHRIFLLALVLVAIAVYANSLWNGFAYDDEWIILRNTRVHQLKDLALIWGTPYWPTFGSELGLYRPLTIFAYALQWAAADGAPWVYHAVNVGLHALVTVLVFLLLRRFVNSVPAALGALVFAVHPVHTEVVANSVGQAELLAAAGMLGACVIHARRQRAAVQMPWLRLWIIAGLYFLTLFAKEAAITLPALLVLMDVAERRVLLLPESIRAYLKHVWLLFFVMAAAAVLYLSIRADVLGSIGGLDAAPGLPFLREEHRVLTAFRAWPEYVRLMFFPNDLSADYSPAVILPVESITRMALLGAGLLTGTLALALTSAARPRLGFPAAWFLITILTVSNLFFPIGVVVAERTLYTPSIAVAALVAFGWEASSVTWSTLRRRMAIAALALAVTLMSYRTIVRNLDWKTTLKVGASIVRDHPESYRAAWLLADQLWRRGDIAQSAYYWEAAILLWPRDSQLLADFANFNIGQKNWKRAIELLEQARKMHPWVPRTHQLLAFSYAHAGRYPEAIQIANEGIRLRGSRAHLLAIKARAYDEQGMTGPAAGAWRAAVHAPGGGLWIYRVMQARALARWGDRAAALASVDTAAQAHALDSTAMVTIRQLQSAIARGCYGHGAAADCSDPVAGWSLTMESRPAVQNVPESQNAKPNATDPKAVVPPSRIP